MPQTPEDLIPFTEVLKNYKPKRWWWDERIARGEITAYLLPAEKTKYLSKAAVEALLEPRPLQVDTDQQEKRQA